MNTDNAHLIALDRANGELLWDTEVANSHLNYSASSAPLAVGHLVITGTAGGEEGARGFIAAFDQKTGKEAWRFWTVPAAGEPGSETWKGKGIEHGSAAAWFTGVYDASTGTVFWQSGNPGEDYNGDDRLGDNLYSDCILALDATTGKLKWYYQTTPHDLWDWDTTETPLVIDANWRGQPRKLLVQGNRNGFFYIFDRTNGELLLAKQFLKDLTWARASVRWPSHLWSRARSHRPQVRTFVPHRTAQLTGIHLPGTRRPVSFTCRPTKSARSIPKDRRTLRWGAPSLEARNGWIRQPRPRRLLRALDLQTGAVKWEVPRIRHCRFLGRDARHGDGAGLLRRG